MSEPSQYQNVFRIAKHDAISNGVESRVTKRNRQIASCSACRTRKLKCDRQFPCSSCSKRGDAISCNYSNCGKNGRTRRDKGSKDSEAQIRLQNLESMVTSLMQTTREVLDKQPGTISSLSGTVDQGLDRLSIRSCPEKLQSSSVGHLDVSGSEINYHGATHWAAILEDIRDIQGALEPDEEDGGETPSYTLPDGPDIMLDTNRSLSLTDFCDFLPPRATVDNLLYQFFNDKYIKPPIIHSGRFLREYESFWVDPFSVSLLWISMLFSALHFGSRVIKATGKEASNPSEDPARPTFLILAGLALVNGKYDKTRPYSVEALLLYGLCKFTQDQDRNTDAWMILGTSTRLAMRMGYHRDPRHLAKISPFEGEMRRRTFMVVETLDLLLSSQAGLPPVIHDDEYDTEPPSNLFDTDFDEDSETIPPSRPPTDPTPMLYYCFKGRLARLVRRTIRHALSLKKRSYEETLKVDNELRQMNQEVPPSLRMRPLSSSIMDEPYMILHRLNIDLMYLKSLCILHRNYLSQGKSNPTFDYSRKSCADAALQMMRHQADLHFACQPGGQFYNDRWMLSSLQLHDFLVAAMAICLDLYESQSKSMGSADLEAQIKKYDALRLSHEIWASRTIVSRDARRASRILAVMLSKVPRPQIPSTSPTPSNHPQQISSNAENPPELLPNSSENSSIYTNGFNTSAQEFDMDMYTLPDLNSTNPLDTLFTESDNIDWGLVDHYLNDNDRGEVGDAAFDWQL